MAVLPSSQKNYHEPFEQTGAFFFPQRLWLAFVFTSMLVGIVLYRVALLIMGLGQTAVQAVSSFGLESVTW